MPRLKFEGKPRIGSETGQKHRPVVDAQRCGHLPAFRDAGECTLLDAG